MRLNAVLITLGLILSLPVNAATKAEIYRESARSIVLINCIDDRGELVSYGSGTLIRNDGIILTNSHVITLNDQECPSYEVNFKPDEITGSTSGQTVGAGGLGEPAVALVIRDSKAYDLALLKVANLPDTVHPMLISDSGYEDVGSEVVAIGHPDGGSLWSITAGTISSSITNFAGVAGYNMYQTDAALNPGNSGGPLINSDGLLVGVNTFIARGNSELALDGLGFAAQASTVRTWLGDDYFSDIPAEVISEKSDNVVPQSTAELDLDEENLDENRFTRFLGKRHFLHILR